MEDKAAIEGAEETRVGKLDPEMTANVLSFLKRLTVYEQVYGEPVELCGGIHYIELEEKWVAPVKLPDGMTMLAWVRSSPERKPPKYLFKEEARRRWLGFMSSQYSRPKYVGEE